MNADVKAKWLAALRGELEESPGKPFEQAHSQLTLQGDFCCLGVLCELYRRDTGKGRWDHSDVVGEHFLTDTGIVEEGSLPVSVRDWAGLGSHDPDVVHDDDNFTSLATLNDHGSDFAELADLIEAQL